MLTGNMLTWLGNHNTKSRRITWAEGANWARASMKKSVSKAM